MRSFFAVNRAMLPLKVVIFLFSASAFSILPYLTIHMKDIGITMDQVAIIYAVIPFTVFVAPAAVGYLADKMGSFTRVLMFTLAGSALFHSTLLLVPPVVRQTHYPLQSAQLQMTSNGTVHLKWTPLPNQCNQQHNHNTSLVTQSTNIHPLTLTLVSCKFQCSPEHRNLQGCQHFNVPTLCSASESGDQLTVKNVSLHISQASDNSATGQLLHLSDSQPLTTKCHAFCNISLDDPEFSSSMVSYGINVEPVLEPCHSVTGNVVLTVTLYFLLRAISTMFMGCNWTLIDAQTIQMCKEEEEEKTGKGNMSSLGRQYMFIALAQAIISPSVGVVMDAIAGDGPPNYLFPFLAQDGFIALILLVLCFVKINVHLPPSPGLKGTKQIFTNPDLCIFLVFYFALGNMWGFIETFLFVYLKDDMGAPMYLLGLTITTGALVAIPFLFVSDWIVGKAGCKNILITAMLAYSVRCLGYSYINDPWLAFPFEAMEAFTLNLMKVGAQTYIGANAPKGLLGTVNGIAGGLHFGFGKGIGGLIGGYMIAGIGSIPVVFRCFGIAAAAIGILYACYEYLLFRPTRTGSAKIKPAVAEDKPPSVITTTEPQGKMTNEVA